MAQHQPQSQQRTRAPSVAASETVTSGSEATSPAARPEARAQDGQRPRVSVVVPAYNCAASLRRCLESLFLQTYPRDRYSITVVDDGSTDDTASAARACAADWSGDLTVLTQPNGGPASARNSGIRAAARAEIVAFLDADCVAASDWLDGLIATLVASPNAAGVGGPLANVLPPGWVSTYLRACSFYRHRVRRGRVEYLVTASVAFRRDALERIGGFHERPGVWGEDADLSFRLTQAGYPLLLAPYGTVTHFGAPATLRGFMRELRRYGYGNARLSRAWGARRSPAAELVRRCGAIALSPALALRYARRVGLRWTPAFLPLVVIEHATFTVGLLEGLVYAAGRGGSGGNSGNGGNGGKSGGGSGASPSTRQRDYARAE